jgi:asparagine synthase (glutamine-hydrolysing)
MSGLCGIVDFAAPRIEPGALRLLAESAAYRAAGGISYRDLGMAGLACLASRAGKKSDPPLFAEDLQVCAVFDGRLDNRAELVARLSPTKGSDASDVDLLLAAYLEWEESCTDRLLGDFAFAVWDGGRRRLVCAVDPLGLKPLYYAHVGSLVIFASDAMQILHHPSVPEDYDEREIAAYLASQPEHPQRSFFAAVCKLPPGHRLVAEGAALRVKRYWDPRPDEIRYKRDEDYASHFREIFARAVADRSREAGKFVAVTMSGGLDSTSVAAMAHQTAGVAVRAYTFVFDRFKNCDERDYSHAMTAEIGLEVEPIATEHLWGLESKTALPISPETPYFGWRYEEIFHGMAGGGSQVLLTGLGGDDLMRGSALAYGERLRRGDLSAVREVYQHARARREPVVQALYRYFGRPHLPARVDALLLAALGRHNALLLPAFIQPDFARRVDLSTRLAADWPQQAFQSSTKQEIYTNLVEAARYRRITNWHDRNASRFGIDVRHPFLDQRLFEYVLAIPGEQIFRLGWTKNLLRRAMAGFLPEKIRLRRGKTSFAPLLDSMIREKDKGEITDILRAPRCAELGFIEENRLRSAYCSYLEGGTNESRRAIWYAITLEIWLRRCEAIRLEWRRVSPVVRSAA